ncbi:MAG: hypothetical protein ACP5MB_10520, partial [bacterium]
MGRGRMQDLKFKIQPPSPVKLSKEFFCVIPLGLRGIKGVTFFLRFITPRPKPCLCSPPSYLKRPSDNSFLYPSLDGRDEREGDRFIKYQSL